MVCDIKEVKLEEIQEIKPKSKHRIRNLCKEIIYVPNMLKPK